MTRILLLVIALAAFAAAPASAQTDRDAARAAVADTLDALHEAAATADFQRYFSLYTEDAVFFGTDASERWSVEDFKGYARGPFDAGTGWTYVPTERHVFLSEDGRTAWFDERLQNANYGETRGTGVMLLTDEGWLITQYNLSIPVPNELARDLVDMIRDLENQD